jgi:S1-C subfamily serine protease
LISPSEKSLKLEPSIFTEEYRVLISPKPSSCGSCGKTAWFAGLRTCVIQPAVWRPPTWFVVVAAALLSASAWTVLVLAVSTVAVREGRAKTTAAAVPPPAYSKLASQIRACAERVQSACVAVVHRRSGNPRGAFSGVIASKEGHILTAAHCIQVGGQYEVILADGRRLKAKALGRSGDLDCGLLQIVEEAEFRWAELGTSSELTRNQPCLSISHPGGFNAKRGLVIRFGRIVGVTRGGYLHNTCRMEPGDSGGGLFDLKGRVIGIHSRIERSLADNFDIPVDSFRVHWDSLCKAREFTPPSIRARFGIGLRSRRATQEGAEVTSVEKDSPAAQAGLLVGDWITTVNETAVTAESRMGRILDRPLQRLMVEAEGAVKLTVRRKSETKTIVLSEGLPKPYAVVRQDRAHQYDAIAKLDGGFASDETLLDDCAVRVTSRKSNREHSLLGTVLSKDGMIVTKSSRLGPSPTVTDASGRTVAARIVGRDDENDLAVLRTEGPFGRCVGPASTSKLMAGEILLSPCPGKGVILLSVVGSRTFRSLRRKQIGFLGVTPAIRDGAVVLNRVGDGPARRAGLKSNDTVVRVDDRLITSVIQMIAVVGSYKPGQEVSVTVRRGEAQRTLPVTLGSRPERMGGHVADDFPGGKSQRYTGFDAVFCHDAPLQPQECGGPLFDAKGNFMGINIARVSRTRCYALPPDLIWKSVAQIQKQSHGSSRLISDSTPSNDQAGVQK